MKTVIITFKQDGTIDSEVQGVKGKACENLTKFMDDAFGKPVKRKLKPEYHQRETQHVRQ